MPRACARSAPTAFAAEANVRLVSMKRYRVIIWDFDTRVHSLVDPISDDWEPHVREMHLEYRKQVEQSLIEQWGNGDCEAKKQNFIDLGRKEFSVIAFHNRFFSQARAAFVVGAYYPALTSACALGERILNHLILALRENYKKTREYKKVYRKDSFDDWSLAIDTLESWDVLLPEAVSEFRALMDMRHKALHFRPETDSNDRQLALDAITCLQRVITAQFAGLGKMPWYFHVPGEIYIKKEWEQVPFVKKVLTPSCAYVGPKHQIVKMFPNVRINDRHEYEDTDVTDEEFKTLRVEQR